jgi:hypothetical protein
VYVAVVARGAVLHGIRNRLVRRHRHLVARAGVEARRGQHPLDEAAALGEAAGADRHGEDLWRHPRTVGQWPRRAQLDEPGWGTRDAVSAGADVWDYGAGPGPEGSGGRNAYDVGAATANPFGGVVRTRAYCIGLN